MTVQQAPPADPTAANFVVQPKPGFSLVNALSLRALETAGLTVKEFLAGVSSQIPGILITRSVSGESSAPVGLGLFNQEITLEGNGELDAPAAEIVQVTYDLVGGYGASSAVATAVTGTNWQNPNNATGTANGTLASHAGTISAQDAYLVFAWPAMAAGKETLTITKVELLWYYSQTGTVLNNGNLRLYFGTSTNSAQNIVATITADSSTLGNPRITDITNQVNTWAGIADLRARVRHTQAAGETPTANVDAVVLRVTATATDIL